MKKFILGIIIGISITAVGCVSASSSSQTGGNIKFSRKSTNDSNIQILTDEETDVQYIEVSKENGVSICPRYSGGSSNYTDTICK